MALAVEWLPEEWPEGIPNLKQLLVVAPLTTSILLLFGCGNRPAHSVANSRADGRPRSARPADFVWRDGAEMRTPQGRSTRRGCAFRAGSGGVAAQSWIASLDRRGDRGRRRVSEWGEGRARLPWWRTIVRRLVRR